MSIFKDGENCCFGTEWEDRLWSDL